MEVIALFSTPRAEYARRDILELAIAFTLLTAAIWTPLPWSALLLLLAIAWVAYGTIITGARVDALGLSVYGMKRDYWVVSAAVLIAITAAFLAVRFHTLHPPFGSTNLELHAGEYLGWALVQQFILQNFFLVRLLRLMPSRSAAVIAAAALFAFAHIPNPVLVLTTLVWGIVACTVFLRYRDLYAIAIAHAILGLTVAFAVPAPLHHQMRVGLGYLTYQPSQVARNNTPATAEPESINTGRSYAAGEAAPE